MYSRYAGWLRARLIRRYGVQDAEDLFQETWLRWAPYDGERSIRHPQALLLRIASNLAINRSHRRRRRSRHLDQTTILEDPIVLPDQAVGVMLKEIILSLPEGSRDVFLLSRLDGLTHMQIAERLGISLAAVEWRMNRALAHCAAQLRR